MKLFAGTGAAGFVVAALWWHGDLSGGELYAMPQSDIYRQIQDLAPHPKIAAFQVQVPDARIDVVAEPALPGVRWHFTHGGDDIGNVVAKLSPASSGRTRVNVYFEPGVTDESKWKIKDVRKALKIVAVATMAEQIDATLEKREVDQSIIADAAVASIITNPQAIQREAISRMDEHAAWEAEDEKREAERKKEQAVREAYANAGKPTTDLSRFNR